MIHTRTAGSTPTNIMLGRKIWTPTDAGRMLPDYGQVWVPNEPDDWAPYRDGNWVYEPYYGWTWVGYEPWGWAPYHYGRWMWYGGAWAWWPGPVWGVGYYRPFWAPAYVSFFGFGGGWGFGFGFGWGGWGGWGWAPIGPCDRFHPWWGGYRGRFGVVSVNHFGTVNHVGGIAPLHSGTQYSNLAHLNDSHISRAVSTVAAGKFGAGRTTAVAATRAQLSSAHMMTGNMPVVPTHASLSASGRAAAPSTIHNGAAQHFFGTQSASRPESFQQATSHLQQSMQQSHFSPSAAGAHATGPGTAESHGTAAARPSAGTASSHPLTPPSNSNTHTESAQPDRSTAAASSVNRPETASAPHSEPNRSEWKTFTPPAHNSESAGGAGGAETGRGESYWNRTAPSTNYSRESGVGNGSSSRPQLNMRQPIAQPRSSGAYGGYHGVPSFGGSHGGGAAHAPSSGGGGHPSGGGGHPSGGGGGGHSSGGGGHH